MRHLRTLCSLLALTLGPAAAAPAKPQAPPLANAEILIVRHAEKDSADGTGLAPAGQQRALAYVGYFRRDPATGQRLHPDHLFAAADGKHSQRPRLTLEPLSHALKMPIDTRFRQNNFGALAQELAARPSGKAILICWHHSEIPGLLRALGADPSALLPRGRWPGKQYGWVIELRYDRQGRLLPAETQRLDERLTPTDGGP